MQAIDGDKTEILRRKMGTRCLCFGVRRAARAVTQAYDVAFRPIGLRATQLTLLFIIQARSPVSLGEIAEHAVMDRTSLTREVEILRRAKLVRVDRGEDRRVKLVSLTRAGQDKVRDGLPIWDDLQQRLRRRLGGARLSSLLGELSAFVDAVRG